VDDRDVRSNLLRYPPWVLMLFLLLAGCATADRDAANFKQAQKLRQNALLAARQGDTATALEDINQAQILEPLATRSPGLRPPPLSGPEHRPIAPAGGQTTTCNNVGINRFYCF